MSIYDVSESDFMERVVERSKEVPVVVDFWAEWCGPCRQLTPALEAAAKAREGKVDLAKVDTDANQRLSQTFRVQGIPAVKAFKDGKVVDEFTGAIPPPQVEKFFDGIVPSEADELIASGTADEESLRAVLASDPRHAGAANQLARLLLQRGENDEAKQVLAPFGGDFLATGLTARAELAAQRDDLDDAWRAWDEGDHATALEALQEAFAAAPDNERDTLRKAMVGIFTELGADNPLAREHRKRLTAALY
jgi:putative thioredoxin